jgi:hypothetical protein
MATGSESRILNTFVIGPNSARAAWEAEEPPHRSLYISLDVGRIYVWDADLGSSDEYRFGGANYALNAVAANSGNTTTITELIGADVLTVDRAGVGIKLVDGTPANGEISFNKTTGVFTLGPDDVFYGEWLRITYSGIEEANYTPPS